MIRLEGPKATGREQRPWCCQTVAVVCQLCALCDISQALGGLVPISGNGEGHSYLMVMLQSLILYQPQAQEGSRRVIFRAVLRNRMDVEGCG